MSSTENSRFENSEQIQSNFAWLRITVLVGLLLSALGAIMKPISWANTFYLIDYEFGFFKRALAGTILHLFRSPPYSAGFLNEISVLVTLLGGFTLVIFLGSAFWKSINGLLLMILFSLSVGFRSIIGAVGYLDSLLLIFTVLALIGDPKNNAVYICRIFLASTAVLIHEGFLPIFAFLLGLDIWLAHPDCKFATRAARAAGPLMAAIATVVLMDAVSNPTGLSPDQLSGYLSTKALDFEVDERVSSAVLQSSQEHLVDMRDYWFGHMQTRQIINIISFAPAPIATVWFLATLAIRTGRISDVYSCLLFLAAATSPLSLHLVAWDTSRIWSFAVVTSFLACAVLVRRNGAARQALEAQPIAFCPFLFVLVLNASSSPAIFSGTTWQFAQFPFSLLNRIFQ